MVIDITPPKLRKIPGRPFTCEHIKSGESKECGKPATHYYFPFVYCGCFFLCKKHAIKTEKDGSEVFEIIQEDG